MGYDKVICDFVSRTFAQWSIRSNRVFQKGHPCPMKGAEGLWVTRGICIRMTPPCISMIGGPCRSLY